MFKNKTLLKIIIFVFCTCNLFILSGCNLGNKSNIDTYLKEAKTILDNGSSTIVQCNNAIELCTKAINLDSRNALAYTIRGRGYNKIDEFDKAIKDSDEAIRLNSTIKGEYYNPYFINGVAYMLKEDYKNSLEDFNKVIEQEPKFSMAYNDRGYCYYYSGIYTGNDRFTKAEAEYNKALSLDKNNEYAYLNLGWLYYDYDYKSQVSMDMFNKAILIAPKMAEAYYGMANWSESNDKPNDTISYCSKAIELSKGYDHAYKLRGIAYADLYKDDLAMKDYNKAIEINPKEPEFYYYRGILYGLNKNYTLSLADYDKSIALAPKVAKYYLNRAILEFYDMNKTNEAFADFDKAIEINPKYAKAYYERGTAYSKMGQTDKGTADKKKASDLDSSYTIWK